MAEPEKKSLLEAVTEIKNTINDKDDELFRLAALKRLGYDIQFCWIKGNEVGRIVFMKRKKEYRMQITPAVIHGDFHKANVVILSEKNYDNDIIA
jgi:fructosamine-3-kinase